MAVFNPGMASGDAALRASWAADLDELLDRQFTCIFTCASDHTDLKGNFEGGRTRLGRLIVAVLANQRGRKASGMWY